MMKRIILFILIGSLLASLVGCQKGPTIRESSDTSDQNVSEEISEDVSKGDSQDSVEDSLEDSVEDSSQDSSQDEITSSHVYTASTVRVHEINDFVYILPNGEMTEDGSVTYVFETDISLGTRDDFIEAETRLLDVLGVQTEDKNENTYTFFLSESYMDRSDSENGTAFFLLSSLRTWQQVLTTIQLLEGDDILYGYAYAKANAVAKELGWETDPTETFTAEELQAFASADPGRMTLIFPCFIEPYSTPNQIELAKALAVEIDKSHGGSADEDAFMLGIQSYAKEHELPYTETYLRFRNGGRSVPLVIQTIFVEEWITKEVQTDGAYMISENEIPDSLNWQKNMTELIRLRELTDTIIADSCAALGYEPSARKEVLWFQWEPSDPYMGWTSFNNDSMTVGSAYTISHEYVHYIHRHVVKSHLPQIQWCIEALAVYYSWPMEVQQANLNQQAAGYEPSTISEYTAESIPFVLNRMRALEKTPTEILYMGENGQVGYYGSYFLIGHYIVEEYGEDVFTQLMIYPENAESLTGKTLEEIIGDWDRYVSELMEGL